MSWFYFPKKKIVVDFFTDKPQLYNYAPVKKASAFLPEWWKAIPSVMEGGDGLHPNPTIKHCAGFSEMYKHGVILPMWCDLAVRVGEVGSNAYQYQFSDRASSLKTHNPAQWGDYYPALEYQHIKLDSPWLCRTNEDVTFMFNPPVWNFKNLGDITFLPGMVNYKYQPGTNVNLFIKRQQAVTDYLIPFNQPLAHIIPLSDRKIDLRVHLVSDHEFRNISELGASVTFLKKYAISKSILQNNKCPFHYKPEK